MRGQERPSRRPFMYSRRTPRRAPAATLLGEGSAARACLCGTPAWRAHVVVCMFAPSLRVSTRAAPSQPDAPGPGPPSRQPPCRAPGVRRRRSGAVAASEASARERRRRRARLTHTRPMARREMKQWGEGSNAGRTAGLGRRRRHRGADRAAHPTPPPPAPLPRASLGPRWQGLPLPAAALRLAGRGGRESPRRPLPRPRRHSHPASRPLGGMAIRRAGGLVRAAMTPWAWANAGHHVRWAPQAVSDVAAPAPSLAPPPSSHLSGAAAAEAAWGGRGWRVRQSCGR